MNITRHLMLSTALRAPDEPAAPEPEVVVEPVAEVAAEPVAAEVQPEPAAAPPIAEPAKPEHGNRGGTPWFMKEIPKLREERAQERTARVAAEQRAADLQAIIERMQADPAAPKPVAAPPASQQQPADFDAAVDARAELKRLYADTAEVRSAGETAFADFGQTLMALNAIGATNDDFVSDLLVAVPKADAHKMLDKLAKDPEKAASLVGMDSRRRIAELTRMADAPKTPEPKPAADPAPKPAAAAISRAPAPKPAISPLSAAAEVDPTTPEGNDKMDDKAWEAWYKNKYQKRA